MTREIPHAHAPMLERRLVEPQPVDALGPAVDAIREDVVVTGEGAGVSALNDGLNREGVLPMAAALSPLGTFLRCVGVSLASHADRRIVRQGVVSLEDQPGEERNGAGCPCGDVEQYDHVVAPPVVHAKFDQEFPSDGLPVEYVVLFAQEGVFHVVGHGGTLSVHRLLEEPQQFRPAVLLPILRRPHPSPIQTLQSIGKHHWRHLLLVEIWLPGNRLTIILHGVQGVASGQEKFQK